MAHIRKPLAVDVDGNLTTYNPKTSQLSNHSTCPGQVRNRWSQWLQLLLPASAPSQEFEEHNLTVLAVTV